MEDFDDFLELALDLRELLRDEFFEKRLELCDLKLLFDLQLDRLPLLEPRDLLRDLADKKLVRLEERDRTLESDDAAPPELGLFTRRGVVEGFVFVFVRVFAGLFVWRDTKDLSEVSLMPKVSCTVAASRSKSPGYALSNKWVCCQEGSKDEKRRFSFWVGIFSR